MRCTEDEEGNGVKTYAINNEEEGEDVSMAVIDDPTRATRYDASPSEDAPRYIGDNDDKNGLKIVEVGNYCRDVQSMN